MPIVLISAASVSTGQTGVGTTPGGDSSGGNFVLVGINSAGAAAYVQGRDNKNPDVSWVNGGLRTLAGVTQYMAMCYLVTPIVGTAHTFRGVELFGPAGVIATAFSGVGAFDKQSSISETASATSHPASDPAAAGGLMTPAAADSLIASIVAFEGDPGVVTASAGLTLLPVSCGPANNYGLYLAYEIQTGLTARTPVFTSTIARRSAGYTMIFGAAASVDSPLPPLVQQFISQAAGRASNF